MNVLAAVVSVVTGSALAWFIGSRVTFGWDEVKRQRESDLAALRSFYDCYGKFFATWKAWNIYVRARGTRPDGSFPVTDDKAWALLRDAEAAEGGFESILVKLAAEYATSERDQLLLASFRQGAQSLREEMRDGRELSWKAQPTSVDRPQHPDQRLLDYRRYRAFKALSEYVALRLADGPRPRSTTSPPRDRMTLLLGLRPARATDEAAAVTALIKITQTAGIADRWYRIAEDVFHLPDARSGASAEVGRQVMTNTPTQAPPAGNGNRIVLHGRRWLRFVDRHRRSLLDWAAAVLFLLSLLILGLAFANDSVGRLTTSDLVQLGSVLLAAGGILLGIGGGRRDS
ncbi:hypothetical protein [Actinoplanes aureus]|uniref:Uncharacterized protein n=1 Tax=Actinoplanes aureus TaxID=2792083 RepID=A0A931C7K2_9ACTN|nr:hypothetical protein [Actinoplanes aureus]MBG0562416.1 hypothetical protein [Actinoplanes aureus]